MKLSRRKALLLGGSVGATTLSGCSGLPLDRPQLTLNLLNFDSERRFLYLELLRTDGSERSESVALTEQFELSPKPEGGGAAVRQESDVVESRKYVVRARLDRARGTSDHYHFYPDCTGDDEPEEELYVEVHREPEGDDPYLRFKRNTCGRNSWWY